MYAPDLYSKRQLAGITSQQTLIRRLPPLPSGRKITRDFYGRIERGEVEIEPAVYNSIVSTIDELGSERAERSAA